MDDNEGGSGGIKDFIAQTNMIGNVIAAAASQKNSYEPLPFANYSLFDETYKQDALKINRNPQASQKHVFVPGVRIYVKVTAERKHGAHIFHPYHYTLAFTQDVHSWEVIRSYKEIKEAHKTLAKIVKVDIGKSCSDLTEDDIKPDWPLFPTEHDHLVSASQIDDRCKKLAEYLERMLTYPPYRDHPAVLALLGVSHLSFVDDIGPSLLEGSLQKRSGDNVYYGHLSQLKICCDKVKIFYDKRWFILKDTYIVYTIPENNDAVGFAMLLDKMFECKMKIRAGAYHAIVIKNLQRSLYLKCKSTSQQREWHEKITQMMQSGPGRLFHEVQYLRNDSFAPVRPNQMAKWYVNAAQYMENVMLGLINAREEIFITDWWLCPELFLKRPSDDLQYRLDKILLKKAQEGVKIYIMLFKEVSIALSLLSSRAKKVLTQNGRNPNIKVLRHPEHSPAGVFLWSHHEKMVIIDQSVAFLGGIDLCFGRWDDDLHRLVDLGRRENKTDIEPTTATTNAIMSLANQIKKFSLDSGVVVRKEADESGSGEASQSTAIQFSPEVVVIPPAPNAEMVKSTTEIAPIPDVTQIKIDNAAVKKDEIAPETGIDIQHKPDALIVAALMGSSIAKFNKMAATKKSGRLVTQMSVPPNTKLGEPNATATTVVTDDSLPTPTPTTHSKVTAVLEKFKSLQYPASHEVGSGGHGVVNSNFQETKSSNAAAVKSATNPADAATATSSSTTTKRNTLNTSKLAVNATNSTSSRAIGSRATKYLSVPTDPSRLADDDDDVDASKKERAKRKWSRFKKSVKKKGHKSNPLRRLRRLSNGSFRMDSDDSDEDSSDGEGDEEGVEEHEENAELPIISYEGYYWIGKDYSNTYKEDFRDLADFSKDQFKRDQIPRMPWRDEALVVFGESARDLARHFIQRWNQCKREKVRQIQSYPFLLPKTYSEPYKYDYSWFKDQLFKCEIQMTRSLDSWSGGLCQTEISILNSYCDLINKAEHFIYIENQFFVTTTDPTKDYEVKNSIGRELVNRILRAHREGKKFRIYIVLPLLPGFENLNAIQAVQFYNLRSINLGDYSIYKALIREGISDPSEYITIHGMRNWAVLMGKLVQEIIYVHSKLMIVDDKWVICGSANVNDRSMLGKRDSEVAAVIKDQEFVEATLNGQKVMVGKYANSLRKKIFKLHLGIYFNNPDKIEVQDCVSDEFYKLFRETSNENTRVYDDVFKCLPSDNILNFQDLATYSERSSLCRHDPYKGKQELEKRVKGFVVDFPLNFLSKEKNFFPEINTPEGMVPTAMWT